MLDKEHGNEAGRCDAAGYRLRRGGHCRHILLIDIHQTNICQRFFLSLDVLDTLLARVAVHHHLTFLDSLYQQ